VISQNLNANLLHLLFFSRNYINLTMLMVIDGFFANRKLEGEKEKKIASGRV
jgi:hypothetical protein